MMKSHCQHRKGRELDDEVRQFGGGRGGGRTNLRITGPRNPLAPGGAAIRQGCPLHPFPRDRHIRYLHASLRPINDAKLFMQARQRVFLCCTDGAMLRVAFTGGMLPAVGRRMAPPTRRARTCSWKLPGVVAATWFRMPRVWSATPGGGGLWGLPRVTNRSTAPTPPCPPPRPPPRSAAKGPAQCRSSPGAPPRAARRHHPRRHLPQCPCQLCPSLCLAGCCIIIAWFGAA